MSADETRDAASVRVWPRTCCIYCGQRLTEPPWLACTRHRYLLRLDPEYTNE